MLFASTQKESQRFQSPLGEVVKETVKACLPNSLSKFQSPLGEVVKETFFSRRLREG